MEIDTQRPRAGDSLLCDEQHVLPESGSNRKRDCTEPTGKKRGGRRQTGWEGDTYAGAEGTKGLLR